jgi:hypothetical protein
VGNGFRVTNPNSTGAHSWQLGPFYNNDDFHLTHTNNDYQTHNATLTVLASNGYVGIGRRDPAYALDVSGEIRGTNLTPSDASLKTDVRTISHALDDVRRMRGVRFKWKANGKPSVGVIAQEVEAVYPELVSTDPDHVKSVEYAQLIGVLIEAVKEQQAQIDELRAQVAKQREVRSAPR